MFDIRKILLTGLVALLAFSGCSSSIEVKKEYQEICYSDVVIKKLDHTPSYYSGSSAGSRITTPSYSGIYFPDRYKIFFTVKDSLHCLKGEGFNFGDFFNRLLERDSLDFCYNAIYEYDISEEGHYCFPPRFLGYDSFRILKKN